MSFDNVLDRLIACEIKLSKAARPRGSSEATQATLSRLKSENDVATTILANYETVLKNCHDYLTTLPRTRKNNTMIAEIATALKILEP